MTAAAVDNARDIGFAARALARAIRSGQDVEGASEALELDAARIVGEPVYGFDAEAAEASAEELLVTAQSELEIGKTLLAGEAAMTAPDHVDDLDAAAAALEKTADSAQLAEADAVMYGFDAGAVTTVREAAATALDEMAMAAGDVTTALLDRALKPIVGRVPESLRNLDKDLDLDIAGRLARWGLRAVRKGLDLLRRLVDLDVVERMRDRIDDVLARLGRGEDASVLAGWVIGADVVRAEAAKSSDDDDRDDLVAELAQLTARFVKLCRLLRGVALTVAGLATALALIHVALPHAAAVTGIALVLVLGAVIVLGRDFTGASDLPGPVRGVLVLLRTPP
jgi:hypothetical protein